MPELYQPRLEDLWFKAQLLGDEQTMSYNHAWGGTIAFPESRWAAWYDRWIVHHEGKRFYRYIRADGVFVGEAAYHFDEEQQIYLADVIIFAAHRGKGYGRAGLQCCATAPAPAASPSCMTASHRTTPASPSFFITALRKSFAPASTSWSGNH